MDVKEDLRNANRFKKITVTSQHIYSLVVAGKPGFTRLDVYAELYWKAKSFFETT